MARRRARAQAQTRQRRTGWYAAGIAVVVAVLVGVLLFFALQGGSSFDPSAYAYPVQRIEPLESREHLAEGVTFDGYNSNPPTSGQHTVVPANWGVYETAVAKEQAVHNLEHGGVVIWYNCNGGDAPLSGAECTDLRQKLTTIAQAALNDGQRVLLSPYAGMERRIALTAWGYLDAFDEFDGTRVQQFIDVFKCVETPESKGC